MNESRRVGSSVLLYLLLVSTFAVFMTSVSPPALAACANAGIKNTASVFDNETTMWGNFGFNYPSYASLCGSSSGEGSYVHLTNGVFTTSDQTNWIEANWYFGYSGDGWSSTSQPAFQWIKFNYWQSPQRTVSDISKGTGIYPNWGDKVNFTLKYDYTDWLGKDYYKLVIYDYNTGWIITITNLWVNGRGASSTFQSETFNTQNVIRGKQLTGEYMDTSNVWHVWTQYDTQITNSHYCVRAVTGSHNSFLFGTKIGVVCRYP